MVILRKPGKYAIADSFIIFFIRNFFLIHYCPVTLNIYAAHAMHLRKNNF